MTIFKHTYTEQSHTYKLLSFLEQIGSNVFFAIGKPTAWDGAVPEPRLSAQIIPEVMFYKRAYELLPALNSNASPISAVYREQDSPLSGNWQLLNAEAIKRGNSYSVFPTHLYVSGLIEPDDYSEAGFHAIGLYIGLTPRSGVATNKILYLPSEVENPGVLQWLSYSDEPVIRDLNTTTKIQVTL